MNKSILQNQAQASKVQAPDFSIIIVNWNTRELLADCLESIAETAGSLNVELIVVDNDSTDGSQAMLQQQFPHVRLILNTENVGFATANNQAVRESSGRYVILLNPDTKILPGALQAQLDFIEQHPEAGVIGPMVLNPDLTLQSSCNPMPTLWREFWRLMFLDRLWPQSVYQEETWDTTVAHRVEVIQGNCLVIRREALLKIGLLDEAFFMFTEEVDLCYRVLQQGWLIYWVPMGRIIHYGGQSTRQAFKKMFLELYRSKVLFFRKIGGRWGGWVYKAILLVTALTRMMGGLISSGKQSQAVQRSQMYRDLLRVLPDF